MSPVVVSNPPVTSAPTKARAESHAGVHPARPEDAFPPWTDEEQEFVASFEQCRLPAEQFTHREHIRLAWLYLKGESVPRVLARFGQNLRAFARHQGQETLYHETITWAWIFIIHERMAQGGSAWTWKEFSAHNPDLFGKGDRSVLGRYYSQKNLQSALARRCFVLPDQVSAGGS